MHLFQRCDFDLREYRLLFVSYRADSDRSDASNLYAAVPLAWIADVFHPEWRGRAEGYAVRDSAGKTSFVFGFRGGPRRVSDLTRCKGVRGHRASVGCLPDEGAALVEMAVSISVFLSVLVGVFFVILALYSYHFVADAAREASRYASVRGSQCSTNTPSLPDCPISTSAPLQSWVRGLKYPYAASLNVTVSYLKPTVSGSPATTTWSACPACNAPGNMVKVSVTYGYPLSIPFWKSTTVNIGSTSSMVISQ